MKKTLGIFLALFLSLPAFAADAGNTGVGVTLGSPYGFTGRTWMTTDQSVDYGFGWDLLNSSKFQVYTDYLLSRPDSFEVNANKLDLFYGVGLVLRTHSTDDENTTVFGPRLPIGVSTWLTHPDMELFAQFALNVGLIPHSDVFVDLNVGARFTLF